MMTVTHQLTIEAKDIKPRDRLVFMDQAKVESVSHLDEFYVRLRFDNQRTPTRIWHYQLVTVIRAVTR